MGPQRPGSRLTWVRPDTRRGPGCADPGRERLTTLFQAYSSAPLTKERAMKVKIRNSASKHRKKTGFLTRKKTRGGRKVNANQRRIAAGKPKRVKLVKARHIKAKKVRQAR